MFCAKYISPIKLKGGKESMAYWHPFSMLNIRKVIIPENRKVIVFLFYD